MSFFKKRSDYIKSLANAHKLVAHGREVSGEVRNSFHRMNDEDELMAACVNWAQFPCVVHCGFNGRYTGDTNAVPKRKILNSILFLHQAGTGMDSIENAYDTAFQVMEDFISKMYSEFTEKGYCSNFSNLDLSRFSFYEYGPIGAQLFGWSLQFEDDVFVDELTRFDQSKWYE